MTAVGDCYKYDLLLVSIDPLTSVGSGFKIIRENFYVKFGFNQFDLV